MQHSTLNTQHATRNTQQKTLHRAKAYHRGCTLPLLLGEAVHTQHAVLDWLVTPVHCERNGVDLQ